MGFHVNLPPHPRHLPKAAPRPKPKPAWPKAPRWGWLEWFVISQTFLPALLFVPGASAIRPIIRIGAYLVAPAAWMMIGYKGGVPGAPSSSTFPARPWLLAVIGWLVLSVFHPNSNSLIAASAQAALYIAVLSPAFWAPRALAEPRQLGRVMAVLFLCNALSAGVGVAQALRPGTFDPPEPPAMKNQFGGADVMYETADGRRIMRPCGLTDTPGSAAPAGGVAALLGLCFALRPGGILKRLAAAGLAFIGVAVIYYTQVRSPLVMLVICVVVLSGLFLVQGRYGQATQLVVGSVVAIGGALLWVARSVGTQVFERFGLLFADDPGSVYRKARGGYVEQALTRVLWDYPFGYGLGWWGMINGTFGDPGKISPIWVEVMVPAWIYDGGFPLLILYVAALIAAMVDTTWIAFTSQDREVAFWAAVVVALNLSIMANCLSFVTFVSPVGLQFWLLAAIVHAADRQTRTKPAASSKPRWLRKPRMAAG